MKLKLINLGVQPLLLCYVISCPVIFPLQIICKKQIISSNMILNKNALEGFLLVWVRQMSSIEKLSFIFLLILQMVEEALLDPSCLEVLWGETEHPSPSWETCCWEVAICHSCSCRPLKAKFIGFISRSGKMSLLSPVPFWKKTFWIQFCLETMCP